MITSNSGISFLTGIEGYSSKAYLDDKKDTARIEYSVGYGHQIQPNEQHLMNGVTSEVARQLLAKDIEAAEAAVRKAITVPLTQDQFDALVSFTYNIGHIGQTGLAGAINARLGEKEIRENFMKWHFSGGKDNPVLTARRQKEADLFFSLKKK